MASTLPTASTLAALSKNYRLGILNRKQQAALNILAKIWQLKNDAGQTDYTANFSQLMQDAATATKGMEAEQVQAALVGQNWAVAAAISGAPGTLSAQLLALRYLVDRPDEDLARINLLLEYLLTQATGD